MPKSQGQTIGKAVIDLGKSEATMGLTFVCLYSAKRLIYFLEESMPFNRFSKLGDKSTSKIRLEDVRLKPLAVETFLRHGV